MSLPSLNSTIKPTGKDLDFDVDDKDLNDILGLVSSDEESAAPKPSSKLSGLYIL